jgi:signal transduction histidine kinase
VGRLVHEELPVRFARRIKQIERVKAWQSVPELVSLHAMHTQSFSEVRMADPSDLEGYPQAIFKIRHRHKDIGPLFAEALRRVSSEALRLRQIQPGELADDESQLDHEGVERWAETFLQSRVWTEMLMSHYVICAEDTKLDAAGEGDFGQTKIGIIDWECDPWEICQLVVTQLDEGPYPVEFTLENLSGTIRLCYAPRYLFFILEELLSNSARATAETASAFPIKIAMCADARQVTIRISDRGGGMPSEALGKLWLGEFTTSMATPDSLGTNFDPELEQLWRSTEIQGWQSPISGRGMGLRLCRLYAGYLGGSLQVINMPGLGLDVYLHLTRMDHI